MGSRVCGARRDRKVARLLDRDGNRCHWCQAEFTDELPPTLEHLTPRHYGGTSDDSNVVLACEPCNNARHHYVRCAGCEGRIRSWAHVVWVDRRDAYHGHCVADQDCRTQVGDSQNGCSQMALRP